MLTVIFSVTPVFLAGLFFILTLKYFPNLLKYPLDFGKSYRGDRIFGENKTLRGPILMGFFTGFFGLALISLVKNSFNITLPFFSYASMGLLYSLGELPNSFIKRRLKIPPGESPKDSYLRKLFKIVDIYDSLVFCGVGYITIFHFDYLLVLISVLLGGAVHYSTDILMKKLKLK